ALAQVEEIEIGVQVNGKFRGTITLPVDAPEEEAVAMARENPKIAKYLADGEVKKVIYVPGKILNIIVNRY
ncbi:MAG: hypothetical protein DRN14_06605, partial [Thermoplasmata archaeon]